MIVVIIYSAICSGWFVFAVLALVHPIVPFVDILGATALWITARGIWFAGVVSQWGLAVLGVVADISSMGVAVILYLSSCGFVADRCIGSWWCTGANGTVSYVP